MKMFSNGDRSISKARCVAELKRVAKKLGRTPTREEFNEQATGFGHTIVVKYFGSWNKGLEAMRLEINKTNETISKARCLAELQRVAKKLGHTPTVAEFDRRYCD